MEKRLHIDSSCAVLRPGRFYKLLHPVGPIPAGIYRCEDQLDEGVIFSVSADRSTYFGLAGLDHSMVTEVPYTRGRRARTRLLEFASHYFNHVSQEAKLACRPKSKGPDNSSTTPLPEAPQLTMCCIPLTGAMLSDRAIMEQMFEIERQMPEGTHFLDSADFHA
jgi:hypothetical protein